MDTFVSNLEAHEDKNKPLSSWQAYTMRPGEKLESIAPRFGMTVANLKAANGIKGRIQLPPGFTLLVAGKDGSDTLNMAALPEQPRLPRQPRTGHQRGRWRTYAHGAQRRQVAGPGKRYGMSVAELKKMNNLRSDKLAAGSRLNVALSY